MDLGQGSALIHHRAGSHWKIWTYVILAFGNSSELLPETNQHVDLVVGNGRDQFHFIRAELLLIENSSVLEPLQFCLCISHFDLLKCIQRFRRILDR